LPSAEEAAADDGEDAEPASEWWNPDTNEDGRVDDAEALYDQLFHEYGPTVAQYAVPMACRIRFTMRMNAREAMHVIELRTQPAGHPSYRRICQGMHRLIREQAGHEAIAEAIRFANHDDAGLGRIDAENRQEQAGAEKAPTPAA